MPVSISEKRTARNSLMFLKQHYKHRSYDNIDWNISFLFRLKLIGQVNYHCPICKGKVVLKNGKIKVPHFAHRDSVCMDNWNYDMSEWHRAWQKIFPEENQEIVIKTEIFNTQYEAAARINGFSDKSYDEFGI